MQRELDLEVVGTGVPDTSNLMRLIQGTVMPQVRAICDYTVFDTFNKLFIHNFL